MIMGFTFTEIITAISGIFGLIISFMLFRQGIKRDMQKALGNKLAEFKNIYTLEKRLDYLEKWSQENLEWQKKEFLLINQKLDAQAEKLEKFVFEFYGRRRV